MVRESTPEEQLAQRRDEFDRKAKEQVKAVHGLTEKIRTSLRAIKPMHGFERQLADRARGLDSMLGQIESYARRTLRSAGDSVGTGSAEADVQENYTGLIGFAGRLKGEVNQTWDRVDEIIIVKEHIESIETLVRNFILEAGFGISTATEDR